MEVKVKENKIGIMDEKLKNLAMLPEDWSKLDKSLPKEEYRKIVNEYQRREEARLPFCKAIFKVCRYLTKECRCNNRNYCKLRMLVEN